MVTSNSAADALLVLEQHHLDILVSDLGMPDEDGYSLISKIRALPAEQGGQIPAAALVTVVASLAGRAYKDTGK